LHVETPGKIGDLDGGVAGAGRGLGWAGIFASEGTAKIVTACGVVWRKSATVVP